EEQAERLAEKVRKGGERLLEIDRDHVPEANAALARWKAELEGVRDELRRIETAQPARDLEQTIAAAEETLWSLHDALKAEDYPLLRQLLRETFGKVELFWEHRKTAKTTRSRLTRGVIHLRPQESADMSSTAGRCSCETGPTAARHRPPRGSGRAAR